MIATTPIPPTINPTLESDTIRILNNSVMLLMACRYFSCVTTSKLLLSRGRRPRIDRIATVTSSMARWTDTLSSGVTNRSIQPGQ